MESTNSSQTTVTETPAVLQNGLLRTQPKWKTLLQNTFGEYGYLLVAASQKGESPEG